MIFEPDLIHTKVVGVSFEGRQQVLQAVERILQTNKEKVSIFLQKDENNPVDPNAIAVWARYYDSTFLSDVTRQLGYIRKELAAQFSDEMKQGYEFEIIDFEPTGGYRKSRGVNINILRKEAGMPTLTAMDLLNQKTSSKTPVLRLTENSILILRFLKPLAEAFVEATHSIKMPDGKYERFAALQYINGVYDDSVRDPAIEAGFSPWVKLVLPVIDRGDGNKVKLFSESVAVYKKLKVFDQQPANDAEKFLKIGGITNADITIMQQGKGKERQINVSANPATFRPLSQEELALPTPNPKDFLKVISASEINGILNRAVAAEKAQVASTMNVSAPRGPLD